MDPTSRGEEKGSTLVVTLVLLTVVITLGMSVMETTLLEERMAGNLQARLQAFEAAEAGAQTVLALYETDTDHYDNKSSAIDMGLDTAMPGAANFGTAEVGAAYWIHSIAYDTASPPLHATIESHGAIHGTGTLVRIETGVQPITGNHTAFAQGLITDSDLKITGGITIQSGTHSNGATLLNGSGNITGDVSAQGSITSTGSIAIGGETLSSAPAKEIPSVTDDVINALRTKAKDNGIYSVMDYTVNGVMDFGDQVIFSEGDLTLNVNATVQNGTFVAVGNIFINGTSALNSENNVGTAIIAQGNITMNGSTTSYGIFWNNGLLSQSGVNGINGSVVSGGDITINGTFDFTYNANLDNDNLPQETTGFTVLRWRQL